MADRLKVIKCSADMVAVWIATLGSSYALAEFSRWMSTVCRKGRNRIMAGIL